MEEKTEITGGGKKPSLAKRIVCITLVAVLFILAVLAVVPRSANYDGDNPMMKDGELPLLIAHGGGNREFPDNTIEAFYNAYSVDQRVMMETDVSITKDGVVILSHDTTIDRKTNKTGAIADWNYSDLIAERRKIYKGVSPNVDFYSGMIYRMLRLPEEMYTPIFAVARIAGWSAHRLEEIQNAGKIIRPAYMCVKDRRDYIPLSER